MKIKLGRFSSSKTKQYVWLRLGDVAEYDKFVSPKYAGIAVGCSFPPTVKFSDLSFNYKFITRSGVEISPYFIERNYISLFWGDKDTQWIRDLSNNEKYIFEQGVEEGLE